MRYRILDIDGDYSFGKGNQNITYGIHAVGQAIKTRLLLLKGEWWENVEEGLPLFQEIIGQKGDSNRLMIADSIIKNRIINTKNVLSTKEFKSEFEDRSYTFSCVVDTKFGELALKEEKLN